MGSSSQSHPWPWLSTVNVANFVTVKPWLKGDERSTTFKKWRKQMLCLLESQDLVGFVDGGRTLPLDIDGQKLWKRTDMLIQGWILGSIGEDALDAVWEKQTARDVWLELDNIFNHQDHQIEDTSRCLLENIFNSKEAAVAEDQISIEDTSTCLMENIFNWNEAAVAEDQINTDDTMPQAAQRNDWKTQLYEAALMNKWDAAKTIFPDITELGTAIISSEKETALHVAVMTGISNDFVKNLVKSIRPEALARKDNFGDTALHNAVLVGNTEAARVLVDKNPDLLCELNKVGELAVIRAAASRNKETLNFLITSHEKHPKHKNLLEDQLGTRLLVYIIRAEYVDVALKLVKEHKIPAELKDDPDHISALSILATMNTLFPRLEALSWWQSFIYHCIPLKKSKSEASSAAADIENGADYDIFTKGQKMKFMFWTAIKRLVPKVMKLGEQKAKRQQALELAECLCDQLLYLPVNEASPMFRRALEKAAMYGISEIVEMIIRKNPEAIYHKDSEGRNVLLVAVRYRHENVMNLFYNMSARRCMLYCGRDNKENNLLHICGKLSPPDRLNLVRGAALQMQRELQWFEEMKEFVQASRQKSKNKETKTPQMIFTEEHKDLKAEGEKWMKDTANACTIAAALIATVMFAAAFTVPGGLESATGIPLFSTEPVFNLFALSDAISLFTSIFALLIFLSILTSRYAEEDFLHVLPNRLIIGLLNLFISITFMMVAFCATFYLIFRRDGAWYIILLGAFACFPVTFFVLLQIPLLVDITGSTFGPSIFRKKKHPLLY